MAGASGRGAYRAGVAVAVVSSLLIVWVTIVRDDGSGAGPFMVILAAGVGAFAARFQPEGLARAMFGVAVMQALLGALTATAPSTAVMADGVFKAWLFGAGFTALWLVSAALFRAAAKAGAS
jgi:hypothetical protein